MWIVSKSTYDLLLSQYNQIVEKHNEVSNRHNDIVDHLVKTERALAKESTLRERLELDLAANQSEYRKVVDTLAMLAKRPTLDTVQALSDLFAEDPKQPTVWLTDDTIPPVETLRKMSEEPAVG